jgi:hypothetical protein
MTVGPDPDRLSRIETQGRFPFRQSLPVMEADGGGTCNAAEWDSKAMPRHLRGSGG